MKGTLEFDLPEDEENFQMAQEGWQWNVIVRALDEFLRGKLKHGKLGDVRRQVYKDLRKELHIFLDDRDLTLD